MRTADACRYFARANGPESAAQPQGMLERLELAWRRILPACCLLARPGPYRVHVFWVGDVAHADRNDHLLILEGSIVNESDAMRPRNRFSPISACRRRLPFSRTTPSSPAR